MAFCKACGQDIGDAAFCPKCGANQGAAAPTATASGESPTAGIEENVAGVLCYVLTWVSGLIFLLLDKRAFVRFHGAQSIALCVAAAVIGIGFWIVVLFLTFLLALVHIPLGFLLALLWPVVGIACFAAWVFCMYKAYQHEKFKLPIIGDIVEKMIGA
jgi:uncharacterized membrane protein